MSNTTRTSYQREAAHAALLLLVLGRSVPMCPCCCGPLCATSVAGEGGFAPRFCFPFVRVVGPNQVVAFEALATLLVNWGQGWFDLWPNPPVQLLRKFLVGGGQRAPTCAAGVLRCIYTPLVAMLAVSQHVFPWDEAAIVSLTAYTWRGRQHYTHVSSILFAAACLLVILRPPPPHTHTHRPC
jgi:hypothetical protein